MNLTWHDVVAFLGLVGGIITAIREFSQTASENNRRSLENSVKAGEQWQVLYNETKKELATVRKEVEEEREKREALEDRVETERKEREVLKERMEAEAKHAAEEMEMAQASIKKLERKVREGVLHQQKSDRQISALRRGINLLIEQITKAGLQPVWNPDEDEDLKDIGD